MNQINPDPFGGGPENWTLPDPDPTPADPWPPTDPAQLAQLNQWCDEQETLSEIEP